ncbi:MAG: PASTA domain-containing protein [Candidatus Hydrogenedentes bacterium]|nr:PASTA domain-containing protein [Candidatus Hydrogenedentota bacterium]
MRIKLTSHLVLFAVFALLCAGCPENKTTTVPTVNGLAVAEAQAAIQGAGLAVGTISYDSSETVAAGIVISQNPAGDAEVNEGTSVNLVVSTGPAQVAVPLVEGMVLAGAEADIEELGLVVGTITYEASDTVAAGSVISQSVSGGTQVDPGTIVNLVVSTGPEETGGKVIGWVRDAVGTPLPEVEVVLDQPTKAGISSTSTNVDGLYSLEDIPPQNGLVLRFSREGYTPNSQYVDIIEDVTTSANSVLLPLAEPVVMDAATGGTIEDLTTGAKLTIPPNAFATAKGAVTGDVTVQMTPLDISDPAQLTAFPGNFRAVEIGAKAGETVTLETFGLVDIRVTQDLGKATETEVELAPGVTAKIEIPLQSDVPKKMYEDLRLWWFNADTGIWEEESNENGGVDPSSSGSGTSFFAEISHFSWWNCDAPLSDKACVRGRVVDEQGAPIAGAQVEARGVSYDGSTYGTTDANGEFCLNVKGGFGCRDPRYAARRLERHCHTGRHGGPRRGFLRSNRHLHGPRRYRGRNDVVHPWRDARRQ